MYNNSPSDASGPSSRPMASSPTRPAATVTGAGTSSSSCSTSTIHRSPTSPTEKTKSASHDDAAAEDVSDAGSSGEQDDKSGKPKKKKEPKKRKVGQACVYCRRSHMTCDSQRPCTRCIKRDIGHLCHDEVPGKGHGHAHHALPKNKPGTTEGGPQGSAAGASSSSPSGPVPVTASAVSKGGLGRMSPPPVPQSAYQAGGANAAGRMPVSGKRAPQLAGRGSQKSPLGGASQTGGPPSTYPFDSPSASTPLNNANSPTNQQTDALQAYITAMQANPSATSELARGLYTSQPTVVSSGNRTPLAASAAPLAAQTMLMRPPPEAGAAGRQTLGGQSSDALGSLVSGNRNSPSAASLSALSAFSPPSSSLTAGGGGSNVGQYGGGNGNWPVSAASPAAAGLGGAGFLGLGGSHGPAFGSQGRGGDIAGGNEYNLLSEFLESLDGPGDPLMASGGPMDTSADRDPFAPESKGTTPVLEKASPWSPADNSSKTQQSPTTSLRGVKRPRNGNAGPRGSIAQTSQAQPSNTTASATTSSSTDPAALKGFATSTKTERFFLTAADQVDGPRDERLTKVIQAKYDAGLLRPYNHVKGYARLNSWMDTHVSPSSRRRILKPLSVFRPRFRAVAQSLSDVDLIYIEEAFERLLLDYDRVFSTQGIPACLWRRTGEVYKGNREFAELVGVGIEELREGRLCIYELMEEESACNYWEKFGAVGFDPGQKAVLTSCVLTPRPHRWRPSAATAAASGAPSGAATPVGTLTRNSLSGPNTNANTSGTATPARGGAGSRPLPENLSMTSTSKDKSSAQPPSAASTSAPATAAQQKANKAGPRLPRRRSSSGSSSASSGSSAGPPAGDDDEQGGKGSNPNVQCCFSFTIRRDRFGVPTAIVGNFLPIAS
ncbi:hypothetical protein BCV69DRAFT_295822 [Microstroma glucosiphilum]|uniref:Zn(2)-C6 fungal-type domain-containing protein n=1 Tax=Pseudomicrostroma glucosiphilum TaxID=1684307 RepID=A0A316UE42_9BASI|nr:hypothetical protein BCV69DRAFT_295822 [Pseudomicrostroma glucosiphilum]PWN23486.1 hypothetical protein BCV69DRAFT_295822 [Pseudomicrostroma glucosiphilum]